MNAAREKALIRDRMRQSRMQLDEAWVAVASAQAERSLMALEAFARARTVACYIALRGEVRTDAILSRCREARKEVVLPAAREDGSYAFAVWPDGEPLIEGALRTREPAGKRWFAAGEVDLFVVPGVAFDGSGRRIGHGAGHYDKLLADARGGERAAWKVGLAFEFQVLPRVPAEERDVPMDVIITEKRIVRCGKTASEKGRTT